MEQIFLSEEQLKELQFIQTKMLYEIDRICKKYDIQYMICGGTLLGAVRNQGFIPWDDDIDVRMLRGEFEKFEKACEKELKESPFFLQTHETDPYYPWFSNKFRYLPSKFVRVGQEHLKMQDGIFVDIFVSDGIPDDYRSRMRVVRKCYILKKFLYSCCGRKNEKNIFKRFAYICMNFVPRKYIFKRMNKIAQKYKDNTKYVFSYADCEWNQSWFLERKWHMETKDYLFDGKYVKGTQYADEWLSVGYGNDYMTPLPVDKRTSNNPIVKFEIYQYLDESVK